MLLLFLMKYIDLNPRSFLDSFYSFSSRANQCSRAIWLYLKKFNDLLSTTSRRNFFT
jgi:hypothetical protein